MAGQPPLFAFAYILSCSSPPLPVMDAVGRFWFPTMLSDYKRNDLGDVELAQISAENGLLSWTQFLTTQRIDDNVVEGLLDCADFIYVGGTVQRVKRGRPNRVSSFGLTRNLHDLLRCMDYGGVSLAVTNAMYAGGDSADVPLSDVLRALVTLHDLADFRYDLYHGSELNMVWIAASYEGVDAVHTCLLFVRNTLLASVDKAVTHGVFSLLGTAVWPQGSYRHHWPEAYATLTGHDYDLPAAFKDEAIVDCATRASRVLGLDPALVTAIIRDDLDDSAQRSEAIQLRDFVHGRLAATTSNIRDTLVTAIAASYRTHSKTDLLCCLIILGVPLVLSDALEVLGDAYGLVGRPQEPDANAWLDE